MPSNYDRQPGAPDVPTISAHEIGRYIYCARAWWLQRVQGYTPTSVVALQLGSHRHEVHGRAVSAVRTRTLLAYILLGVAIILGLALLFSLRIP